MPRASPPTSGAPSRRGSGASVAASVTSARSHYGTFYDEQRAQQWQQQQQQQHYTRQAAQRQQQQQQQAAAAMAAMRYRRAQLAMGAGAPRGNIMPAYSAPAASPSAGMPPYTALPLPPRHALAPSSYVSEAGFAGTARPGAMAAAGPAGGGGGGGSPRSRVDSRRQSRIRRGSGEKDALM